MAAGVAIAVAVLGVAGVVVSGSRRFTEILAEVIAQMRCRGFLYLAIFVSSPGLSGPCDCVPVKGISLFGSVEVGEDMSRLDKNTLNSGCEKPDEPGYFSCEATDIHGVAYLIDGKEITRKEVRNVPRYLGKLPFGIHRTDSLYAVLRKAKQAGAPEFGIGVNSETFLIATDYCFEGKNGT